MSELLKIKANDIQEGSTAVMAQWLVKVGEIVEKDQPLGEMETDKVNVEILAPSRVEVVELLTTEGQSLSMDEVLCVLRPQTHDKKASSHSTTNPTDTNIEVKEKVLEGDEDDSGFISPLVQTLLKKYNLRAEQIKGSGRGGRVSKADVEKYIRTYDPAASIENAHEDHERVPLSLMRRQIGEHMVNSMLRKAPHVTALFEANLAAVIKHRNAHKEAYASEGIKLTFNSYFVAAAARAVETVPEVNSTLHENEIELHRKVNMGIATAIEDGLIVPVLHDVNRHDFKGLCLEQQALIQRARDGQLSAADVRSGTLSITNHGGGGSLMATPIINQPQSAILGVGKIEKKPVVVNDGGEEKIEIQTRVYLTITIDHRVLDGHRANAYMSRFIELLENWQ